MTAKTEWEKAEAWAEKLQKLVDKAPKRVWLFAASGSMNVMLADEDGRHIFDGEVVSQEAIVVSVEVDCDGGDW